ncbi:hypothetical protein OG596_32835 [Streptomyces sp. NBC_01102]|uniref:hypothetical protein n=1 Tax=Streptomyces sp. NBC_01102 TaxID=2903749 RepID=UPI0038685EA5|nr:hypothetical protein OG596_32835 [Streptomyces sp. NBC_01102]
MRPPSSSYISRHLRTAEHLDQSLAALARMTGYFSAGLPVRHILADFPDETMKAVAAWTRDEDFRLRPAGERGHPAPAALGPTDRAPRRHGPARPRDLLRRPAPLRPHPRGRPPGGHRRHRPDLVPATLQRWKASGRVTGDQFAFLARNALSNRLKEGRPPVYALLGYAHDAPVTLTPLVLERTELRAGDTLNFSAVLTATAPVHVMIVIATTGPSGRPREKVAFVRRATVEPGHELRLAKAHPLRSTARWKVSPGSYSLALQINGRRFPAVAFTVLDT